MAESHINWDTFKQLSQDLSTRITPDFKPDILVAIARGGWIPVRVLSDLLNVKTIASIGLRYANAERTDFDLYSRPTLAAEHQSILLVEDCLESGKSLQEAKNIFTNEGKTVKTCALFYSSLSVIIPDYSLGHKDPTPIFPWE